MSAASLHAGMRIGGYVLVRCIGRGGMAEVWCARRASERRTSKFAAIKVVADAYVGDPRFQRMFRSEAELAALLNHVNIVQVFDEGQDADRSYLVMEWVDGLNLLKLEAALALVDDEALKHQLIAYIIGQLLHALSYAHSVTLLDGNPLGIVHRDVSPHNVLISNRGEVKLTDFGVAHHLLEESSGAHVKGKIRYMSPEQLAGHSRDPRVDLYAVGALLHEMLDGRLFRCHVEDQRELYIEVLSGRVPELWGPVPAELDALRRGLLEADPEQRVPTADAALELLERYPGYGDARRVLGQLCGGITGVVKPRVGMDASGAVQAAVEPSRELASQTLVVSPLPPGAPAALVRGDTSPWPPVVSRAHDGGGITAVVGDAIGVGSAWLGEAAPAPMEVVSPKRARAGWSAMAPLLFGLAMITGGVTALHVLGDEPEGLVKPPPSPVTTVVPREGQERDAGVREAAPTRGEEAGSTGTTGASGETADGVGSHASSGASAEPSPAEPSPAEPSPAEPSPAEPSPAGGSSRSPASAPERPPAKPRAPRVTSALSVAAEPSLLPLEVRLAGKTYRVTKLGALGRVPVGNYGVKWRRRGETAWRDEVRVEVEPECELNLKITAAAGLIPRPMGKGCT